MGFFDLFRPRWKHSDPAIRIDAVKSLTPEDVIELGQVVRRDKDARVRRLALKKISDPALLEAHRAARQVEPEGAHHALAGDVACRVELRFERVAPGPQRARVVRPQVLDVERLQSALLHGQ